MSDNTIRFYAKEFAANYSGDRREAVGQVMGPNTMGEYFKAVSATFDEVANRTRLVFDLVPRKPVARPERPRIEPVRSHRYQPLRRVRIAR